MIFIADFFALGLVLILFMFFYDSKSKMRRMPPSSKIFAAVLGLTAINALTDLLACFLLLQRGVPVWLNMLVNSAYFITNLLTTSCIALFLFTKMLEHTHRRHCKRNALIALTVILVFYVAVVISNVWNGVLFYFDEQGVYCRGPLNILGYILTLAQMGLVLICYFRNKETAGRPMRRALINVFPVIPFCFIIQRLFPEIMLNSILIAFADVVLFMTFMGQRHGVHSLTELNDRHRFFDEVDHLIGKEEPFQIFLINIKNFGSINRKLGHLVGDEYLYLFAFALENVLKGSMTFHMNGTVFAVVSRYTYQKVAEKQSADLLQFLAQGIDFDEYHVETEYVLSHYIADGQETNAADIFEIMEGSAAKAYDLNQQYVLCSQNVREEIARKRYLRERMEKVDAQHGFEVWFQPIKCLATGKFCSMEALVRLREPSGELVSPAEFIPLAEETGQISAITWFVLEEVCKTLCRSPELESASVAINLPMTQLLEEDFVARFLRTVDHAEVDHRRICIEFTERTIMENFQLTKTVMQQLSDEGFRFYLDDFGAGYSNFNCLLQLPFQIIKFDSGFLQKKKNGANDFTAVRALTELFHNMNLTVVLEGVETQEELQALADTGIDRIQGYVFSRPLPLPELLQFYREAPSL